MILFWKMVGKPHGKMKVRVASIHRHPSSRGSITHVGENPPWLVCCGTQMKSQQASSLLLLLQGSIASGPKIPVSLSWSPVWRYWHGKGNPWTLARPMEYHPHNVRLMGGLNLAGVGQNYLEWVLINVDAKLSLPGLPCGHSLLHSTSMPSTEVVRRCSPVAD